MVLNGLGERKLLSRTIKEKYKTPKEIDKGETYAAISREHGITKLTMSGWIKEKSKIYEEVRGLEDF